VKRLQPPTSTAALLALLLTTSACGTSTRELKADYLASFAVVNVKRFYGTEVTLPLQRRRLDDAELAALRKELTQLARDLITAHNDLKLYLVEAFGPETVGLRDVLVYVTQEDVPSANSPKPGEIEVDVFVLDSLFRGTLLDANANSAGGIAPYGPIWRREEVAFEPVTEERRRQEFNAVKRLLETIRTVESIPGRTIVGDMINALRLDPSESFTLLLAKWELEAYEPLYRGSQRFLLAHEIGHTVLKHHALRDPSGTVGHCAARRRMEYEADAYAVVLLGYRIRKAVVRDRSTQDEGLRDVPEDMFAGLTGYRNFFEYTYKIAGFGGDGKDPTCEYPSVAERFEAAAALYDKLRSADWTGPRNIVKEHLNELAGK